MSNVDDSTVGRISESKDDDDDDGSKKEGSLTETKPADNKKLRKLSSQSESFDNGEGEDLDPRVQKELEELNAATDGINHLETELSETQTLFNRSLEDATRRLKELHKKLGKCVDKARPYYEVLKAAKNARTKLHDVSLTYELAQTRHFNAKREVLTAEKLVDKSVDGKLDPVLQELMNKVTTEVMDAAVDLSRAEKEYNSVNVDFNKKHAELQQTYNKLKSDVGKSRPFFEMKSDLNKQLEVQRQRLLKIQEGIELSKDAYSQTLRKLQIISDDIHNTRHLKKLGLVDAEQHQEPSNDCSSSASNHELVSSVSIDDSRSLSSEICDDDISWEGGGSTTSKDIEATLLHSELQHERPVDNAILSSRRSADGVKEIDRHSAVVEDQVLEGNIRSKAVCSVEEDFSGTVMKVSDAMKGMQDDLPSPFECITSHSLEYSMHSGGTGDCIDSGNTT